MPDHPRPLQHLLRAQSGGAARAQLGVPRSDRKSTRLNSSHANISYAVFCLKKKNKPRNRLPTEIQSELSSLDLNKKRLHENHIQKRRLSSYELVPFVLSPPARAHHHTTHAS